MPEKDAVAITVDQSADAKHFNFTYAPTTLHLERGARVRFHINQGDAKVSSVDLYFDHSPFAGGETEIHIGDGKPAQQVIGNQRGAFHYKARGDALINKEVRAAFDIWCPSIIVD